MHCTADILLFAWSIQSACRTQMRPVHAPTKPSSSEFLGIEEKATLQVREFVMDNARTLLGGDSASVLTVSARLALAAKLACGSEDSGGVLSTLDVTDTLEQVRSRSLSLSRMRLYNAPCQSAACSNKRRYI